MVGKMNAQNNKKDYPKSIGDIQYNSNIDDPNFKICNPSRSFQYYNFLKGFQYKGEKYEILKLWKDTYKPVQHLSKKTGYITIRFLVNCEGKTGLFRAQQMNEDYKEEIFDEKLVTTVLDFVKNLGGWIIGEYKGEKVDYYQYLTFKIEDGIVKEILP